MCKDVPIVEQGVTLVKCVSQKTYHRTDQSNDY